MHSKHFEHFKCIQDITIQIYNKIPIYNTNSDRYRFHLITDLTYSREKDVNKTISSNQISKMLEGEQQKKEIKNFHVFIYITYR